ncbi:MFS-type transporter clz9-like [Portunus trituberculatus]|uniref:MFS-type transporter clz9-like n=1 Tax=Portunus trituberculatus TaxID=210409 RepID=UPI001E1CC050|nr:MFS-type transporter clz9-like [Portunus trituberculatus]
MRAFFKRHPEIRERIGQPLGRERAIVTKDALGEWFQQMKHYLDTIDPTLLTSPDRIFNADESGFNICPKTKKIISMTGAKHVYSVTSGKRQQVTMLACSSAMGQYLPPLLIFPYTRDPRFNALEGFEEAFFQKTPNGWITEVVFLSFLRDIFIPKLGEKRPVVLFVDGHSSHHSLAICTLCNENGVILYCLKAHASHLIQPLDQAFFGAIKLAWSEAVRKFQYQTGESVTMCTFARTLKKAWDTTARPELAYKGFVKQAEAKLQFLQRCSSHSPYLSIFWHHCSSRMYPNNLNLCSFCFTSSQIQVPWARTKNSHSLSILQHF